MDISKLDTNFLKSTESLDGKEVYSVLNEPFELYGISYDNENKCFVRAPYNLAKSISNPLEVLNTCTTGGRVRFSTDSKKIVIAVKYRYLVKVPHMASSGFAGFTLMEDYANGKTVWVKTFMPPVKDNETGYTDAVDFEKSEFTPRKGKYGMRNFTLHFPLYNDYIEGVFIGVEKGSKVEKGLPYRSVKPVLYYGSSITQGGCANRADNLYQGFISKWSNTDYINLGYSGNGKAEPEMVKYLASIDCSVFVCDYDHNAGTPEYLEKTHYPLYKAFRETHPDTPIVFLSSPDWFKFPKNRTARRRVIEANYKRAKAEGDNNVYYISGKNIMGDALEHGFVDGTHPNDLGFYKMAKAIYKVIKPFITK